MKSIISLEKLRSDIEEHIKFSKKQLRDYEAGYIQLSLIAVASAEENLEKNKSLVEKYTMMIDQLYKLDNSDPRQKAKIEECIDKKKYYYNNKIRLENDKVKDNDEKLDICMILDEVKEDIFIENQSLFDMAFKKIEHYLIIDTDAKSEFLEIKKDFTNDIQNIKDIYINDLGMINIKSIILISQFKILIVNIKQTMEEKELEPLLNLPKFEHWWIDELWENHLSYFALMDWKYKISLFCLTEEQKDAWDYIFSKWLFIKKFLNNKGEIAYEYQFIFDTYLLKYIELDEEIDESNIEYNKERIRKMVKDIDLKPLGDDYDFSTNHLKYKQEMSK